MSAATRRADKRYARIAHREGMDGSLRALWEGRRAGLTAAQTLAVRTQETGVRGDGNVFGHDNSIFSGAGKVTKARYLDYRSERGPTGNGGMQGVGPLQLTFYTFQDEADRLGGCWLPIFNYRVGYSHLAHLIQMHGLRRALGVYNAGERKPNYVYADDVLKLIVWWHKKLY